MRFFGAQLSFALAASYALAQSASITYPPAGSALTAGSNTTIQVTVPAGTNVIWVSLGISSCSDGPCVPPYGDVGTGLYQGSFTTDAGYPYENFTVTIPADFPAGYASLNLIDLYFAGGAPQPVMGFANESVIVVS